MKVDAHTPTRIAVIYYSATGTVHRLAHAGCRRVKIETEEVQHAA